MTRCKPLPEIIGKFKLITDLGWDGKKRWAIFECPICFKPCKKRVDAIKKYDSCGCAFFTPGVSLRLQRIHNGMMARCHRKTHVHYNRYGGRGILVCDEWRKPKQFYKWALLNGYQDNLSIDRINNDEGYNTENCRWVTSLKNGRNKRNSITEEVAKQIQSEPKRIPLDKLCEKYKIKKSTLKAIKYKQNWKNL